MKSQQSYAKQKPLEMANMAPPLPYPSTKLYTSKDGQLEKCGRCEEPGITYGSYERVTRASLTTSAVYAPRGTLCNTL
jgi:hypothetical protein